MEIERLVVGQLQTNCYLAYSQESDECLIIDPGDDADFIINKINSLDLIPTFIIATHGHFDHLLAVNELKSAFKAPFCLHKKDEVMLKWYRRSTIHFTSFDPGPPPKVDKYLNKGDDQFTKFEIIHTPGHTPGGICLYNKKEKILFSGDTIFSGGGVGRTDFPYSDKKVLEKSIDKLMRLPKNTTVYPGHADPTSINNFRSLYK